MLKDWYYFAWHNTGGTGACEGTPKYFIVILCVCRELVLSHCPELFQSAMFYLNNYDCKTCFVLSNITSWEKKMCYLLCSGTFRNIDQFDPTAYY